MEAVIGIDGGGSRTRAVVADSAGRVLGLGNAGSSNYNHVGAERAGEAIEQAVQEALGQAGLARPVGSMFLGMAAVVNAADQAAIREQVEKRGLAERIGVDHDIRIALTGGLAGQPGIALIAGTGSSCYGRNAEGEAVQVGGCGALADDAGSGFWIGRKALGRAVREADGRADETDLKTVVFDFLEIDALEDFLHRVHVIGLEREELATLCPRIIALAGAGCGPAQGIVQEAVGELALLVSTAARRLRLAEPGIVLAGGVATSGHPFQSHLVNAIKEAVPGARFPAPLLPPVGGAVLEALRLTGVEAAESLVIQMKESLNHA